MGTVVVAGVGEELWSGVGSLVWGGAGVIVRTLIGAGDGAGVGAGAQGNPFAKNSLDSRP